MKTILILLFIMSLAFSAGAQVTNAIPDVNNYTATIDQLVSWNNKLLGLPSGVLTLLVVFGFNSMLYYAEFFPNRKIPVFSVAVSAVLYFLMSWKVGAIAFPTPIWQTKNFVIGCIIGIAAWVFSLRWGEKLFLKAAGRPDPAPPLPPLLPPPQKLEIDVHGIIPVVSEKPATPEKPKQDN